MSIHSAEEIPMLEKPKHCCTHNSALDKYTPCIKCTCLNEALHCSHSTPSSRWHKLYSNKHFSPFPTNLHDTFLRDARKCKLCVMNVPPAYTWQYSVGCSNSVAHATILIPVQRSCVSLQSCNCNCNCNLSMKQCPYAV